MKAVKKTLSVLLSFLLIVNMFACLPITVEAVDIDSYYDFYSEMSGGGDVTNIRLLCDIRDDSAYEIASGRVVTIDLNGHDYSCRTRLLEPPFRIREGGRLIITNSGSEGGNIYGFS